MQLVELPGRRARPGRDPHPPPRLRPELHRRLPAHRPVPEPAAAGAGHGRRRRRRGGGRGRDAPEGGRPRRLRQPPAGQLLRGARDAGQVRGASCPTRIDFETGAAMMLKGLTAQYLLKKTLPQGGLQAGDFVLFHAAAGGVGLIACQWARGAGPAADRHRRQRRQVRAGAGARRGARHQLPQRGLRRAREGDHRRPGREGGLRLGRQGHLRQSRSTACARSA